MCISINYNSLSNIIIKCVIVEFNETLINNKQSGVKIIRILNALQSDDDHIEFALINYIVIMIITIIIIIHECRVHNPRRPTGSKTTFGLRSRSRSLLSV